MTARLRLAAANQQPSAARAAALAANPCLCLRPLALMTRPWLKEEKIGPAPALVCHSRRRCRRLSALQPNVPESPVRRRARTRRRNALAQTRTTVRWEERRTPPLPNKKNGGAVTAVKPNWSWFSRNWDHVAVATCSACCTVSPSNTTVPLITWAEDGRTPSSRWSRWTGSWDAPVSESERSVPDPPIGSELQHTHTHTHTALTSASGRRRTRPRLTSVGPQVDAPFLHTGWSSSP